jgi:hypothetical protein
MYKYITFNALLYITGTLNGSNYIFVSDDFRSVGDEILTTLQTFCTLAETIVFNAWFNFKQSSYITKQVVSEKEMLEHIGTILNEFKLNTIAQFQQGLALIEFHSMNMFAVASENINLTASDTLNSSKSIVDYYYQSKNWSGCSCALSDQCADHIGFYNYPHYLIFNVPGIYVGCFMLQSILQSSLECFFNQTYVNAVLVEVGLYGLMDINSLQPNTTRFPPETPIQISVNQLMIEQWGDQITYQQYYEQCAPQLCTYTLTQHNDVSYIITLLIGLVGGISVVLKTIVPFIVRWIRNRYRVNVNPALNNHLHLAWNQLKIKIKEFNLFETELSWNDEHRRRKEIRTTRIYLLLLIISIIILISFTSISTENEYITISYPSQTIFNRLNSLYSTSLECPCQSITIDYSSFISINISFHQFCSSDFIDLNSGWIDMLYSYGIDEKHPYDDFQLFALPQFRTLSSLCILANQTWTNSLNLFASQTLITDQVKFEETIQSEAQIAVDQFRLSTSGTFVRMLDFIRYMAQGNGIVSAIQSNYYFHSLNKTEGSSLWATPRSYGDENNCSCVTNSMCTSSAAINGTFISGFRIGCYVLDALLQSTLECLYNVTCIDTIKSLYQAENIDIRPFDPDLSSPNETVQSLVNILFIDQWNTNISYDQYYYRGQLISPLSYFFLFFPRWGPIDLPPLLFFLVLSIFLLFINLLTIGGSMSCSASCDILYQ